MNQEEMEKRYREAIDLCNAKREAEAVPVFEALAKQGYTRAQHQLGVFYRLGIVFERDDAKAVEWFHKAATQGYVHAQTSLAFCYQHGLGAEQDLVKMLELYEKAAAQEDARGQNQLGNCYYKGEGVDQDYVKAIEWYRKAAAQDDDGAQYSLGVCYYDGKGVEQDYAKAVEWFDKAAAQGHSDAQYYLGGCYLNAQGVERDVAKALELFRKSAEQGDTDAQNILEELSKMGIDTGAPAEQYKTTFNYMLCHRVIPHMFFSMLDFFYEEIINSPESMQYFMQKAMENGTGAANKNPEIEPAFPAEQFTIKLIGDTPEKSVVVVDILNVDRDCDCVRIAFTCNREQARYFTCELSSDPLTGRPFFIVGEWQPRGDSFSHINYGAIDFHEESFPGRVIKIVYGEGGEQ